MAGFKINIEKATLTNRAYRKVLYTTTEMQLVLMTLLPREYIDMERHEHTTQFIRVESGNGVAYIGQKKYILKDGDALVIPSNTNHYIKNTGKNSLKLYTIYSSPEHPDKTIQPRKVAGKSVVDKLE